MLLTIFYCDGIFGCYRARAGRKTRSSQTRSNSLVSGSARLVRIFKQAKLRFQLGRITSQLELAREPLTSQNEPTLINSLAKYIVASLAHDHNPRPTKEPEAHNVDGDIELWSFQPVWWEAISKCGSDIITSTLCIVKIFFAISLK
jgi:hypothetical protein